MGLVHIMDFNEQPVEVDISASSAELDEAVLKFHSDGAGARSTLDLVVTGGPRDNAVGLVESIIEIVLVQVLLLLHPLELLSLLQLQFHSKDILFKLLLSSVLLFSKLLGLSLLLFRKLFVILPCFWMHYSTFRLWEKCSWLNLYQGGFLLNCLLLHIFLLLYYHLLPFELSLDFSFKLGYLKVTFDNLRLNLVHLLALMRCVGCISMMLILHLDSLIIFTSNIVFLFLQGVHYWLDIFLLD